MSMMLNPVQSSCLYNEDSLDEFVGKILKLVNSPLYREQIAHAVSLYLPLSKEEQLQSQSFFFDIACAKMVLECSILTSDDPEVRVSDREHGEALKEACYRNFALHYRDSSEAYGNVEELPQMPMNYLQLYEDAYDTFSMHGVGQLLARQLLKRLNSPVNSPGPQAIAKLVQFVDHYQFRHFWTILRDESDVFMSAVDEVWNQWEYRTSVSSPEYDTPATMCWLNTSYNVRHNQNCEYFQNTKHGRSCGQDEGKACRICGG